MDDAYGWRNRWPKGLSPERSVAGWGNLLSAPNIYGGRIIRALEWYSMVWKASGSGSSLHVALDHHRRHIIRLNRASSEAVHAMTQVLNDLVR